MAGNEGLQIDGIEDVIGKMIKMGLAPGKELAKAFGAVGDMMVKTARQKLDEYTFPFGKGQLRADLQWKIHRRRKFGAAGWIGASQETSRHAHLVEFGFKRRKLKTEGGGTAQVAGRPYLAPAFNEKKSAAEQKVGAVFWDAVRNAG